MDYKATHYHKHNENTTCMVLESTNKGYKTLIKEGKKKPKTMYFYTIDFSNDKGFWITCE